VIFWRQTRPYQRYSQIETDTQRCSHRLEKSQMLSK